MPSVQSFSAIRDSEIVTCPHCNLRQYQRDDNCARCHADLGVRYVIFQIGAQHDPRQEDGSRQLACWIGGLLRSLRKRRGICQVELARMSAKIDRSYLSKAESGLALLPLNKLLPLVRSLGLTTVILRFEDPRPRTKPTSSGRG
jgi:hypothetical protein